MGLSPPMPGTHPEIGIICALPLEADAVEASFDEFWDDHQPNFHTTPGDVNAYTVGRIGKHAVVLTHMPGMGVISAASVASSFRGSFPGLKLTIVVGICGGVPKSPYDEEILLGDVIISPGVVEYDSNGKRLGAGRRTKTFQSLDDPTRIADALDTMKEPECMAALQNMTATYLTDICAELETSYPGADKDKLFHPAYPHRHHDPTVCSICNDQTTCQRSREATCEQLQCDESHLVHRDRLSAASQDSTPAIHIGMLASGDLVMKSGQHRDEIARDNIIGFDMEGAGVHGVVPNVIVMKGVCDYADSHKNKSWQKYAAASAAACMKAFLDKWNL